MREQLRLERDAEIDKALNKLEEESSLRIKELEQQVHIVKIFILVFAEY